MITDEVYGKLAKIKGKKSFSELLNELSAKRAEARKRAFLRLAGMLTDKEAEEMKRRINEMRKYATVEGA